MTKDEAMKLALEGAANYIDTLGGDSRKYRQALAEQPAQQEPVVCIIGTRGSAFDSPITKRAYTYKEQPGNAVASKLGRACNEAGKQRAGDNIDRGLGLLQELQNEGFGVFALGAEYTVTQQEPVAFEEWLAKQHGDPEEIGFLQALRIAYIAGQDSITSPPAQTQVGTIGHIGNGRTTLTAALAPLLAAQPQQEPVAIVAVDGVGQIQVGWITKPQHNDKLYTSPPQRTWVGLTDKELNDLVKELYGLPITLSYAIEAKLKEKNT